MRFLFSAAAIATLSMILAISSLVYTFLSNSDDFQPITHMEVALSDELAVTGETTTLSLSYCVDEGINSAFLSTSWIGENTQNVLGQATIIPPVQRGCGTLETEVVVPDNLEPGNWWLVLNAAAIGDEQTQLATAITDPLVVLHSEQV